MDTLFVADRNFGVYSVVRAAVSANAHLLVRLTACRAKKLARDAQLTLGDRLDHLVLWDPTLNDKCRPDLSRDPVTGRLIAARISRRGFKTFTLYLFTTLVDPQITVQELVELYGERWQVELNLRHVKSDLNLFFLNCKSADMAHKLWLAGLIAYNLVRYVMSAAAALSRQSVFKLSFCRALKALLHWLPLMAHNGPTTTALWIGLMKRIARFTSPKRKKARPSEPRSVRPAHSALPILKGDRAAARKKLALANANS